MVAVSRSRDSRRHSGARGFERVEVAADAARGAGDDSLAALAAGEKFAGGEIDRLVDVRAAGVAEQGADINVVDSAEDALANVRTRQLQIGVRGEIHNSGFVKRSERADQRVCRALHFLRIAKHARTRVDYENDAGRLAGRVEIGHRPLDSVLEDPEVAAP